MFQKKENSTVHQTMKKNKIWNYVFIPYSIHMIINQKLILLKSLLPKVNSKLVWNPNPHRTGSPNCNAKTH